METPENTFAVGLLADSAEIARFRDHRTEGILGRLWRRFEQKLFLFSEGKGEMGAGELAFAACVLKRPDLTSAAVKQALKNAHGPWSGWIHPEAGCMTLGGMQRTIELCLAIDWTWPFLNRDQREALLGGLVAKSVENLSCAPEGFRTEDDRGMLLLVRRLDASDPHCLHKRPEQLNNWDIWFATALLMAVSLVDRAFFHPAKDEPALEWGRYYRVGYDLDAERIARWQAIAMERIRGAIANQVGEDGDYGEGINYMGYGGRALMYAIRVAQRALGVDLLTEGMARLPFWARNQFPADPEFGAVNFNDSKLFVKPAFPVHANLASLRQDPRVQGYLSEAMISNRSVPDLIDLLGVDPTLSEEAVTLPTDTCYRKIGQVIWRTSQTRDGVFFALQCGAHGGAHQHRDRGTFHLAAYGEHLLVDAGDNRTLERPPIIAHEETRAHNMILIDGRGQIGDNDHPVHGRITDYRSDEPRSTVLADASDCYAGVSLCRRRVVFLRPDMMVIADRVDGDGPRVVWPAQGYNADGLSAWSFHGQLAVLKRPRAHLYMYFAEPVSGWECFSAEMDGRERQLLHVEARIDASRATVVLIPTRPSEAPPCFSQTADGVIRVGFHGRDTVIGREHERVTVGGNSYGV